MVENPSLTGAGAIRHGSRTRNETRWLRNRRPAGDRSNRQAQSGKARVLSHTIRQEKVSANRHRIAFTPVSGQLTFSITLVVCFRLAAVPVTVIVKAPCGVPVCVGGGGLVVPALELPPPHEAHSNAIGNTATA